MCQITVFSYHSVLVLFLKAFEFRKFWGKKSEVRRFQDGSISEAVVWCNTSATLAQKRMICCQIVSYLLNEKFDIPVGIQVIYVADQLDSLLARQTVRLHISLHYGITKKKSEYGMTKT
jgi:predicted transcriptional regulator